MTMNMGHIKSAIRDIPDFPKPGIVFKDITPILHDPKLFRAAVRIFARRLKEKNITKIVAIESRGFLFGAAVAHHLGLGLVLVRKKGKLPHKTVEASYALEYGSATIEMHKDALTRNDRVVILDDLLATGGTAAATARLVRRLGARVVECDFLIELTFLNGRRKLKGFRVFAPIKF
jgi:adenine phosphoribosyltransferase